MRASNHSAVSLVPAPREWAVHDGQWANGAGSAAALEMSQGPLAIHLASPPFALESGYLYSFRFRGETDGVGAVNFALAPAGSFASAEDWIRRRVVRGAGPFSGAFAYLAANDGDYRLLLTNPEGSGKAEGAVLRGLDVEISRTGPVHELEDMTPPDTCLPHWGPVRRRIHGWCKNSKWVNAFVSAVEMQLGREEVLSLPSFLALCPTGQCNALCDFCSVTINRTGIIKRQLPWKSLSRFLQPVQKTLQMTGLEGNGEPTLYKEFDELVSVVKQHDSEVYLITNGSRLLPEQIPNVLQLNAVTFSLNAATPETHRRVMKLKNWEDVVRNIRAIVTERGMAANPIVHASFVVYDYNIHELQDFLRFAEWELEVDKIVIRPLSELGSDVLGTMEDVRDIVPYESDVRDAVEAAREYLADVPRRRYLTELGGGETVIEFDPDSFHNVRPDPVSRVIAPHGFEDRLLPPRRSGWRPVTDAVSVRWHLNAMTVHCDGIAPDGPVLVSEFIPVNPGRDLVLGFRMLSGYGGPVRVTVKAETGEVLAERDIQPEGGAYLPGEVEIPVSTGGHRRVWIQLGKHRGRFLAQIDWGRVRRPGCAISETFMVPNARRWGRDNPDVAVRWTGSAIDIRYGGGGTGYLYKSYLIPCRENAPVEIPVAADIRTGRVALGVLDQTAANWVAQLDFAPGDTGQTLRFDTGANSQVRLVLSSKDGGAIDGTLDFGDRVEPPGAFDSEAPAVDDPFNRIHFVDLGRGELPDPTVPPRPFRWNAETAEIDVRGDGTEIALRRDAAGPEFLVFTPPIVTPMNTPVDFSISCVEGNAGNLAIQLQSDGSGEFVWSYDLERGGVQQFDPGEVGAVRLVISSLQAGPINVVLRLDGPDRTGRRLIDLDAVQRQAEATAANQAGPLPESTDPEAATEAAGADLPQVGAARSDASRTKASSAGQTGAAAQPAAPARRRGWNGWPFRGPKSAIYCQKPWTDLNNFTVDGRMDVCCIATGASQTRYALGNILTDDFQSIWNGPAAREFRRTVNTPDKLPPCARCPMAQSYSGLFFAEEYTRGEILHAMRKRFGMRVGYRLSLLVSSVLERLHFRYLRK